MLLWPGSWLVVGVAVVFLLVSVVVGGSLSSQLNAGGFVDPDTEAFAVSERLEDLTGVTPEASVIALIETDEPIDWEHTREEVERLKARLRSMGPVNLLALDEDLSVARSFIDGELERFG